MKKLGKNTLSNILAKLWSMLSIYLFIPLYISILGETAYGLVSVFATLQSTLNILGMGLSNTLRREFASGIENEDNNGRKYKLLRSVELFYIVIGIGIVCLCFFGSDYLANKWLNIENLDPQLVSQVITLMGISIALQLVANLYSGCLFGLEQQMLANFLCIAWSSMKSIGSLLIIWFIQPNLVLFYEWHIIIDLIYVIVLRLKVVSFCHCQRRWKVSDLKNIGSIWQYTIGILVISLISLVNRQLDKVVISRLLSLTDLGAYNVACTLGSLAAILPTAVYTSVFPIFTKYATTDRKEELEEIFLIVNRLVNIVLTCMGGYIAVFSNELIFVWTHSDVYVESLGVTAFFVVLAIVVLEFQQIPYALALAYGNTKINIKVGFLFLPIVFISTFFGISKHGLLGAGVVYFMMMLGQTLLYQICICKSYFHKSKLRVIFIDSYLPLFLCIFLAIAVKYLVGICIQSPIIQVVFAVLAGALTLVAVGKVYISKKDFLQLLNQ